MALNIKIDFGNKYELSYITEDLKFGVFESKLFDGTSMRLGIKISSDTHPLIPDVYNLAFGPLDTDFQINDWQKIRHQDHSRVFSTIVFAALSFLDTNKGKFIGIDGSDTTRAYMYYRCILSNLEHLGSIFDIFGVNYYVRVLRNGIEDISDIVALPRQILPGQIIPSSQLYNYFIFTVKSAAKTNS